MSNISRDDLIFAIKLKCKDCCNYIPLEYKKCEIFGCPLWPFRLLKLDKTRLKYSLCCEKKGD